MNTAPQRSPKRSPVSSGTMYRVPPEYTQVIEHATRTLRWRERDTDPIRRERVQSTIRKLLRITARAIAGEVQGWVEVYPSRRESYPGQVALAAAAAANTLLDAITDKAPTETLLTHCDTLLRALHNNPTPLT